MTAIVWDDVNERPYELGIDRGLLHVPGDSVLPWNGLISVNESEIDKLELRSHFDGVTYANFQFGESYQAAVKAYGFPEEFTGILGYREMFPGLSVTAQPRIEFDFSYRTMIGETDYKLHFVHNATAESKRRDAATISDEIEPEELEWVITAIPPTPPEFSLFRPTSHIIINSITVDPLSLSVIEDYLYGTEITDPTFLTQEQILGVFAAPPEGP